MKQDIELEKLNESDLFPYQREAVDWISKKTYALLALEMGLGKSCVSLLGLDRIRAKKILVVAPSIALANWKRELQIWSTMDRSYLIARKLTDMPTKGQSLICSYDFATANYKKLVAMGWDGIIIDEVHYIKNPRSKRAKAIMGAHGLVRSTPVFYMLSGTPATNNASELWLMLYTGGITKLSYEAFIKRFCMTRETDYGLKIDGANVSRIPELRSLLNKIMLRRLKKDVMKQLPPITYSHLLVEPGKVDFSILPSFVQYFLPYPEIDRLERDLNKQKDLLEAVWGNMKTEGSEAIAAIAAINNSVSTLRRYIGLQKVEACLTYVKACFLNKTFEKVVIFGIHNDVIEQLRVGLKEFKPQTLYGKTPAAKRQKKIDKFQNNPKVRVFIGNIRASGIAINLTNAHNVIFIEQDWCPGNNAQAVMRVHRIGQQNHVSVKYLAIADSLDERIMFILKKKIRDLTDIFDKDFTKV